MAVTMFGLLDVCTSEELERFLFMETLFMGKHERKARLAPNVTRCLIKEGTNISSTGVDYRTLSRNAL